MPFASLKSLIPQLALWLGVTPATIYERQRALVRAGLLQGLSGRGPGSGVRATPESVALLLIALLATENLSETVEQTKLFANLRNVDPGKRCPLTGKRTLASAFAAALASPDLAKQLRHLTSQRGRRVWTEIAFSKDEEQTDWRRWKGSHFGLTLAERNVDLGDPPTLARRSLLRVPFLELANLFGANK